MINNEELVLNFVDIAKGIKQWLFGNNSTEAEKVEEIDYPEMNMVLIECSFCGHPNTCIETIIKGCKRIRPYYRFCSSCNGDVMVMEQLNE